MAITIGMIARRARSSLEKATETELESRISWAERFAEYCVLAIVAGLMIDLAKAIWPMVPFYDRWASVAAEGLIVLGVYFELHFSRFASLAHTELRHRTDEQLGEAWSIADKADERARAANEMAREAMGIPSWRYRD